MTTAAAPKFVQPSKLYWDSSGRRNARRHESGRSRLFLDSNLVWKQTEMLCSRWNFGARNQPSAKNKSPFGTFDDSLRAFAQTPISRQLGFSFASLRVKSKRKSHPCVDHTRAPPKLSYFCSTIEERNVEITSQFLATNGSRSCHGWFQCFECFALAVCCHALRHRG